MADMFDRRTNFSDPTDFVVTVPIGFTHPDAPGLKGLDAWIAEGDAAGDDPDTGQEWWFTTYGHLPVMQDGSRLYIVCEDRVRGYAPLVKVMFDKSRFRGGRAPVAFVRKGGAVAVTIPDRVVGFRGFRYRWWDRSEEVAFPDWKTTDRRHQPTHI